MLIRLSRIAVLAASAAHFQVAFSTGTPARKRSAPHDVELFDDLLDALKVMQDSYFQPWLGTWPEAIDWTAAVMGTHVSGALSSLSRGLEKFAAAGIDDYKAKENLITSYFSQVLGFYFGQDAFSIRNQAFDDILWVVLGWLESINFINLHTKLFYAAGSGSVGTSGRGISDILDNQTWHGNLWSPVFAHRSRIFWDLGEKGWDTKLCNGGMNWNPRLTPYKNAITNELFIAASISMYLYFPGDDNTSPFNNPKDPRVVDPDVTGPAGPHDEKHLKAAVDGYAWLAGVGMQNSEGLYVDGFHITGWDDVKNPGTKCDARNEMVYTYNQGVLLTGLLGLWKATGDDRYLYDGHRLVRAVIKATGFDFEKGKPVDDIDRLKPGELPPWHGLGRAGILEDQCDVSGTCSQNGQTFKGIFFHHLTAFCTVLDEEIRLDARRVDHRKLKMKREEHSNLCSAYIGWIRRNAVAALATRDGAGKFGQWWTAGLLNTGSRDISADYLASSPDMEAVDYRNFGVPNDEIWRPRRAHAVPGQRQFGVSDQVPIRQGEPAADPGMARRTTAGDSSDPNTRGRGRTVETQGGGLAVLRALWEISGYRSG